MDQDAVMKEMATRLVEDMDPAKAKSVLLAVVSGTDLHEAILDDGTQPVEPKPRRKKGGGRKKKVVVPPEPGNEE